MRSESADGGLGPSEARLWEIVFPDQADHLGTVSLGYRVLRFWNNDVLENSEGVYGMIQIALSDSPHPDLPPHAGEGEEQADHRLQQPHACNRKETP